MDSKNFCDVCKSFLISVYDKNQKKFISSCYKCGAVYNLRKEMIGYSESKNSNMMYVNYIEAAKLDETFPQVEKKCSKCSNPIMVFFKKENLKKVYVCQKCGNIE